MSLELQHDIAEVLNRHSAENGSNTPDFLLAEFLTKVLEAWNDTVKARAMWYERYDSPGQSAANRGGKP